MDKIKEYLELVMDRFGDNKKVAIVVVVMLGVLVIASVAMAQPNQDHTCQGGHNCNGGSNGEGYIVTTDVVITNDTGVTNNVGANSNSGGNSLSATTGESRASSESTGGSAQSSSGGSVSNVSFERASAGAASVFAGHCNSGASGQVSGGGFSVVNSEQFCDYIRMADIMWQAYQRETASCRCEGVCTDVLASVEMVCLQDGEADKFLEAYRENIWDAHALLQATEETATVGRVAGQVITPMAIIMALILL